MRPSDQGQPRAARRSLKLSASPAPGHRQPAARTLEAARAIFATRGYERTTIRAVAAQADIDPSMVMRYFESKAGLFAAAASAIRVSDLGSVPARRRGELLVRHFVDRWESNPNGTR